MSGPLGILASNTHSGTRNSKFRSEIEPECGEDLFFCLHLKLGKKLRTEIKLLSLTKLRKNISPSRTLFNQQKSSRMNVHVLFLRFVCSKIRNQMWSYCNFKSFSI